MLQQFHTIYVSNLDLHVLFLNKIRIQGLNRNVTEVKKNKKKKNKKKPSDYIIMRI